MWYRPAGVVCLVAGTAWAFGAAPHALGSPVTGGMNLIFGPVLLLVLGVIWVTSPRIDRPPTSPEPAPVTEHDEEAPA